MHIAVLDDNIADRKHLERLLDRESDRRIQTTGNLYIDSYGAVETLMEAPKKQYDFFMIDMKGPVALSIEVVKNLRAQGVQVPLCIMRNKSELIPEFEDLAEELLFIEKPIIVAQLSDLIGAALEVKKQKDEELAKENERLIEEEINSQKKKGLFGRIFK